MTPRMRGDHSVERVTPPHSTSSTILTTGAITTRSGLPIRMRSAKGKVEQIGNHLAILPKLQHPSNRTPLQHLHMYPKQLPLKQQWLQFVRNRIHLYEGEGNELS